MVFLIVALAAGAFASWAAPAVTGRPVARSVRWPALLARHRNTVLPVGCVVLAAVGAPPPWLAGCVLVLLTAHLLLTDALTAGPTTARRLPFLAAFLASTAAGGVVLAAALAPATTTDWARLPAALALLGAALAVAAALWTHRSGREHRS